MNETATRPPLTEAELATWPWLREHAVTITLQPDGDGYLVKLPGKKPQRVRTLDEAPGVLLAEVAR